MIRHEEKRMKANQLFFIFFISMLVCLLAFQIKAKNVLLEVETVHFANGIDKNKCFAKCEDCGNKYELVSFESKCPCKYKKILCPHCEKSINITIGKGE